MNTNAALDQIFVVWTDDAFSLAYTVKNANIACAGGLAYS